MNEISMIETLMSLAAIALNLIKAIIGLASEAHKEKNRKENGE